MGELTEQTSGRTVCRFPVKIVLSIILIFFAIGLRAADETAVYRVVGLSHIEREEDFRKTVAEVPELSLVSLDFGKAEATLRFDPAKIVPNTKPDQTVPPEKVLEQIDKLIRQVSTGTFNITARAVGGASLTKLEIPIGVLDCKGCRYGAYLAVAKIEGVDRASVSDGSVLTAWIDSQKTNREALVEALKKARVEIPEN
jgi:hypothetical protein